jgi:anthranilate synthase component 1
MTIESYRRVHHIVSAVRGRLRVGTTPADLIRATFPGGTITGCPKIRSMQIIQELEGRAARGAYTGSCGYISRHGSIDTNILIRTLVVRDGEIRFRTGAGIVADSDPEAELQETRHKAHGLLDALRR